MANQEEIIAGEVTEVLALETSLTELEAELSQNEQFRNFLARQKDTKDQIDAFWKRVEAEMIEHGVKTVKGDWGTLTIAERIGWDTTDELPSKFFKKVVDTKKLTDTFHLEGKAPNGATPKYTKYLTKRIKGQVSTEVDAIVKGAK